MYTDSIELVELKKKYKELLEQVKTSPIFGECLAIASEVLEEPARKHIELKERNKKLVEKHDELADRNEKLIDKHAELTDRNNELMYRNDQFAETNRELTDRYIELTGRNRELTETSRELTNEINSKLEKINNDAFHRIE